MCVGVKGDWDFRILVNFGEVRRDQLAKSTLLTSMLVPLGSFKVCSDAEQRVGFRKQWEATTPIYPWRYSPEEPRPTEVAAAR